MASRNLIGLAAVALATIIAGCHSVDEPGGLLEPLPADQGVISQVGLDGSVTRGPGAVSADPVGLPGATGETAGLPGDTAGFASGESGLAGGMGIPQAVDASGEVGAADAPIDPVGVPGEGLVADGFPAGATDPGLPGGAGTPLPPDAVASPGQMPGGVAAAGPEPGPAPPGPEHAGVAAAPPPARPGAQPPVAPGPAAPAQAGAWGAPPAPPPGVVAGPGVAQPPLLPVPPPSDFAALAALDRLPHSSLPPAAAPGMGQPPVRCEPLPPLIAAHADDFTMVDAWLDGATWFARLRDPAGRMFTVQAGDRVGSEGGKILKIARGLVQVGEISFDPAGTAFISVHSIRLDL